MENTRRRYRGGSDFKNSKYDEIQSPDTLTMMHNKVKELKDNKSFYRSKDQSQQPYLAHKRNQEETWN